MRLAKTTARTGPFSRAFWRARSIRDGDWKQRSRERRLEASRLGAAEGQRETVAEGDVPGDGQADPGALGTTRAGFATTKARLGEVSRTP